MIVREKLRYALILQLRIIPNSTDLTPLKGFCKRVSELK